LYLKIEQLKPYSKNARTHSLRQIRQIAESIRAFGFTNPVLIDSKNSIIAGHSRVEAAKLLGMDQVPTICLENLTEDQIRAYILADNKLAENAAWDKSILAIELQHFHTDREQLNWPSSLALLLLDFPATVAVLRKYSRRIDLRLQNPPLSKLGIFPVPVRTVPTVFVEFWHWLHSLQKSFHLRNFAGFCCASVTVSTLAHCCLNTICYFKTTSHHSEVEADFLFRLDRRISDLRAKRDGRRWKWRKRLVLTAVSWQMLNAANAMFPSIIWR
jgi:hypothetical protein